METTFVGRFSASRNISLLVAPAMHKNSSPFKSEILLLTSPFYRSAGETVHIFQSCLIFLCLLHGSFLTRAQWKTALTRLLSKPEAHVKTRPATSCAHSFAFMVYLPIARRSCPIRNNLSLKSCRCVICTLGISILTRLTYCAEKGAPC